METTKLTWTVIQTGGFPGTVGMVMGRGLTKARARALATRLGTGYTSRPEVA